MCVLMCCSRVMNKLARSFAAGCLCAVLVGCTHTVIGNGSGLPSPDGRLRLAVQIHGASGKAYVDQTKKRVFFWVEPSGTNTAAPLFATNHVLVASGVHWHIHWLSTNEVSVDLVDYCPGVSGYSPQRTVTNHLARFSFAEMGGVWGEREEP